MDLGILPEDLKLLGRFYQNDLFLEVVEERGCISLIPPKNATRSIRNLTLGLALLAGGMCGMGAWLASIREDVSFLTRVFMYLFLIFIWCCAVIGPYIAHTWRIRYLQSISPLLSFCHETGVVSIHAQSTQKKRDEVIAVIGLASCGDDTDKKTELQVLAKDGESIRQYLVATSIFGTVDGVFRDQIRKFCAASQIPGFVVDQTKKKKRIALRTKHCTCVLEMV
jgi:hypothetical protein